MSFWELLVVIVVGLLVIGPERLPEALRTGALWFGRMKRAINNTRVEFEQQLGMDEIRRELHNEQVLASLRALEESTENFKNKIQQADADLQAEIKRIENSADEPAVEHDANADAHLGVNDGAETDKQSEPEPEEEHEPDPHAEVNSNPEHFRRR